MVETNQSSLVSHVFSHSYIKIKLITLAQERIPTKIGARLRLIPMEFTSTESGDIVRQIAQVMSNMDLKLIITNFVYLVAMLGSNSKGNFFLFYTFKLLKFTQIQQIT